MKRWSRWLLVVCVLAILGWAYWKFAIPTHRVETHSELIMLVIWTVITNGLATT